MSFKFPVLGTAFSALLLLSACAEGPNQNEKTRDYAAIGAAVGALAGLATGDDATERRQHATVGAGGGALVGAAIGQYFDRQEEQLQQQLAGSGIGVKRTTPTTIDLSLPGDVTFDTASAAISPQFYGTLDQVASTLTQYPQTRITIIGHTDNRGSYEYNQRLSEARARSVADYLMRRGVSGSRVLTAGRSYTEPVATNATPQGQAVNRRVAMTLTPLQQG